MSDPCERPECGGEVHTDGWGTPIRCPRRSIIRTTCAVHHADGQGNVIPCPGYPHAGDSDDFIRKQCPHCEEAVPRNRVDEHVRSAHSDLPPCIARIDNEHGLYTCAFRAGHKDGEHGDWHASAYGGPAGRTVWTDGARGAVPHQAVAPVTETKPDAARPEFVIALYEGDGTLTLGIRPDGQLQTGPNYQPDPAAREFWDAVTRAAQVASPWRVS